MPGPDLCILQVLSGLVLLGQRVYSAKSRWHLNRVLKEVRIASAVVPRWEVPRVHWQEARPERRSLISHADN